MTQREKPPLGLTPADHGMNPLAAKLHAMHLDVCARSGISPWDFCLALANVQARILAGSKDMPEAKALERIDGLRDVIAAAYREERHGGNRGGTA